MSLDNILNDNHFLLITQSRTKLKLNNSTSEAIIQFLNECYNSINSKNHTISVYLDLSKAFETIDHDILYHKLYHIEIRGNLYCFKSYLSFRNLKLLIATEKSRTQTLYKAFRHVETLYQTLVKQTLLLVNKR